MSSTQLSTRAPSHGFHPVGFRNAGMLREVDLTAQLRLLWRRRFFLLGVAALTVALSAGLIRQWAPIYTAEALVLIQPNAPLVAHLESVAAPLSAEQPSVDSQLQLIRSPDLAERVVAELQLDQDPEFNSRLRTAHSLSEQAAGLVSGFFATLLGGEPTGQRQTEVASTSASSEEGNGKVVAQFQSRFSANFKGGRTFVVAVQFSSTDPKKAALIANTIAQTYISGRIDAKVAAARRASDSIGGELEALRKRVVDTEGEAERFSQSEGLATYRGIKVNEQQMSDTNAQLGVARVEEARAEARLNEAGRTQSNPASEAASSEVLHSPLIGGLRQDEARLLREKADLEVTLGPQHPKIKKIKASLQMIQATIREEIGKIVDNLKSELELARARRVELERTVATLQLNGVSVADKEVRLRELEREASASRSLYTTLLTRALETRAQQTLQLADAEVASPANVPLEPSFPRARQLLPAAGGVGLLLGAVIVWLMERMRTGIAGEEEAQQISGIPVIMTMPKARARQAGRGLISNLAFRLNDSMRPLEVAVGQNGPGKLVLVASALPKEGRSTTASALALRIARSGRSCLLVDCDLRGSIVDRRGGAKAKAGLMQLLAGERSLPEVIYADDEPGLDVLPSGVTRLTAADRARSVRPEDRLAAILSSEAMSILFRGLAARYDMVVIDSPPIIGSPDALILSTHVDQTVLVVRWAATSRRAIVSTVQELQAAGARLPGIVLTHAPSKQGRAALHGVEPAAAAGYFGYH